MSLIVAAKWTAVATIVLAVFAIITAWYARKAFRGQSEEIEPLKDQLKDQKDLNEKQTPVLELQAKELEASLKQRTDQAEAERQAQANRVAAWFAWYPVDTVFSGNANAWGAVIRNDSDLPILSVRVFFHYIQAFSTASEEWQPIERGGPPDRILVIAPRSEEFVMIPDQIKNMIEHRHDDS